MSQRKPHTIASGLALFSMFFGGGNLVFPMLLGAGAGSGVSIAIIGFFITAVLCPLAGLLAMMLFDGDHHSFFGRLGPRFGALVYFVVQVVLVPLGSGPRLFTVAYGTLQNYLPGISLLGFTLISCVIVFACTWKKQRIVDLLGFVLTPILLVALGAILITGLVHPPPLQETAATSASLFGEGLIVGYNLQDVIAAFLFATLVLATFKIYTDRLDPREGRKVLIRRFCTSSLIAAFLLGLIYAGMAFVAAAYVPTLPQNIPPEQLLNAAAMRLLGTKGALIASIAVAMACLTTAISLVFIFADYLEHDLFKGKRGRLLPLVITLGVITYMANLGFKKIADFLTPILAIIYPALIVLAVLNILYKLYQFKPIKIPFYVTLGLSLLYYFW